LRWSNLKSFPNWISKRQDMSLLFAINAFICIGVVAFPDNPKYGGVKLWQPMFPFLVLLAAWALDICIEHLSDIAKLKGKLKQLVGGALTLLCLLPGFFGLLNNYPDLLTYYNELAGNTQGGAEMGMERQYYDQCYKSYIHFWNEQKQWKNIKISYEPNQREYQRTYPWYKRLDKLRRDVTFVKPDRARFLILTHERRWPRYPSLLQEYRLEKEIYTHKINGVPMYTVYDLKPEEDRKKPAKAAKKRPGKKREVRREDERVQNPVEKQNKQLIKIIKTP